MEGLQIGRIVHFVTAGTADGKYQSNHIPAIVVEITGESSEAGDAIVTLVSFYNNGLAFKTNVAYDAEAKAGTWHWPERV